MADLDDAQERRRQFTAVRDTAAKKAAETRERKNIDGTRIKNPKMRSQQAANLAADKAQASMLLRKKTISPASVHKLLHVVYISRSKSIWTSPNLREKMHAGISTVLGKLFFALFGLI